jgi:hypothetical protein
VGGRSGVAGRRLASSRPAPRPSACPRVRPSDRLAAVTAPMATTSCQAQLTMRPDLGSRAGSSDPARPWRSARSPSRNPHGREGPKKGPCSPSTGRVIHAAKAPMRAVGLARLVHRDRRRMRHPWLPMRGSRGADQLGVHRALPVAVIAGHCTATIPEPTHAPERPSVQPHRTERPETDPQGCREHDRSARTDPRPPRPRIRRAQRTSSRTGR